MELSELLALLQYEVQKSYDFTERLAKGDAGPNTSTLQIALERMEVDIPVSFSKSERTFNRAEKAMQPLPTFAKRFRLPYVPERLAVIKKGRIPKGEVKGRSLNVELISSIEKIDETRKEENIARLKMIFKPVMK